MHADHCVSLVARHYVRAGRDTPEVTLFFLMRQEAFWSRLIFIYSKLHGTKTTQKAWVWVKVPLPPHSLRCDVDVDSSCLSVLGPMVMTIYLSPLNHCSVSLGDSAVPRKWSGGTGIPGSTGVQCSLCHHCLLVNCSWGKQVVTWLELSNLIGQLVTQLDLSNVIGQLVTWLDMSDLIGQLLAKVESIQ